MGGKILTEAPPVLKAPRYQEWVRDSRNIYMMGAYTVSKYFYTPGSKPVISGAYYWLCVISPVWLSLIEVRHAVNADLENFKISDPLSINEVRFTGRSPRAACLRKKSASWLF